jgi:integrase
VAIYKRGEVYWYKFRFVGREIRESAKTKLKTLAKKAEEKRKRELQEGYNDLLDHRDARVQKLSVVAESYLDDYVLRHRSEQFAHYAISHVTRHLGEKLVVDISDKTVRTYQNMPLKEAAAPKTINEEVGFLLRLLGERGDSIRSKMRRDKTLKLKGRPYVGKAYSQDQKDALLRAAQIGYVSSGAKPTRTNPGTRSPFIKPALALAFNTAMRHAEIRNLKWGRIDFEKRYLTVGRSKSEAGEGRTIPLNSDLFDALTDHARWYTKRFGTLDPEWHVFPGRVGRPDKGKTRPYDPTRPVTSLKTAWKNVKAKTGVAGRLHDARHTLITELAENGEGDQTIMDIAGHVSKQMLARYSHIRMEPKRAALEAISSKRRSEGVNSQRTEADPTQQPTETERAQNWAQSPSDDQELEPEVIDLIGSSGRTRTYNPSVNSCGGQFYY